ncbi:ethanolamine ammonia-lyase subunit EutC [Rhodopseudomonas sp. B29]|uniref:ethanolamine ammonia-lyase subunit EutC n=1 Tax=Rhodopseudomonas sp. B29 TaxID=95607 RepID=UPI00034D69CF|nr:ethanolamine ammonia-lyase subunit EutC [Rhodopseudomonas sp. B29]
MADLKADRPGEGLPDLRRMTEARILLGRFGAGLPTRAVQSFQLDHARARQAVWSEVDRAALRNELGELTVEIAEAHSMASTREEFVRRPDLGRRLSPDSISGLGKLPRGRDVVIVLGDGLSASAVTTNGAAVTRAVLERLDAASMSVSAVVLAAQARVALADPIGELLEARVAIMLIGERPGLSAADSLGAYLTYGPKSGTPDSRRNCISNIRRGGLAIDEAADSMTALVALMLKTGISGVGLQSAASNLLPEDAKLIGLSPAAIGSKTEPH